MRNHGNTLLFFACWSAAVFGGLASLILPTMVCAYEPANERTKASSPHRRYKLPRGDQVATLLEFIRGMDAFEPDPGPESQQHAIRAPRAIRKACGKIMELEDEPTSDARRFAERRLLAMDLDELQGDDPQEADEWLVRFQAFDPRPENDDATLTLELCEWLIAHDRVESALAICDQYGERFAGSTDMAAVTSGERLKGIARRIRLPGTRLPITGTAVDGSQLSAETLAGKMVVVHFWTTTSPDCHEAVAALKRVYHDYHPQGLEIVGVCCDGDPTLLSKYLRTVQLPWPILHDVQRGPDHPLAVAYGVSRYPATILIDPDGRVLASDMKTQALRRAVEKMLGPSIRGERIGRFPVLNSGQRAQKLIDGAASLIGINEARSLAELRRHADRRSCEIDLPIPHLDRVNDEELYRRCVASVFAVGGIYRNPDTEDWELAQATAFAVTANGVLSTSGHVFADDELELVSMVAMDARGKIYAVEEILAIDELADTCLFRIAANDLLPLPLSRDPAPEPVPGTRIRIVSHPGDSYYYLTSGIISNYESDDDENRWMNVTADFGQGSSGAPVLDQRGNVVGQVSRTATLFAGPDAEVALPAEVKRLGKRQPGTRRPAIRGTQRTLQEKERESAPALEPQMVFKMCVPVDIMRRLVR